jgi:hypothetical protein
MEKHVVFYHGTFHDGSMWNHWINSPSLNAYTIHTPTLYSKDNIGEHSLSDYVRTAQEHLETLDGKVHLVG